MPFCRRNTISNKVRKALASGPRSFTELVAACELSPNTRDPEAAVRAVVVRLENAGLVKCVDGLWQTSDGRPVSPLSRRILSVLSESSSPVPGTELAAIGTSNNRGSEVHTELRRLETAGLVRRAGTRKTSPDGKGGRKSILWELVRQEASK